VQLFPLRDLAGQITNLRTDVDFLLRAQRQQGTGQAANSPTPSSISKSPSMTSLPYANGHASVTSAASNETKASIATLSAQLSGLTQSVAQLMSSHETQATPRARPPLPLLPPSSNSIVSQRNISGSSTASAQPSLAERWAPVTALLAPALSQALLSLPALGPPTKIQLKAIPCLIAASKEDIVCQASSALEGLVSYSLSAIHVASIGPSQAATVSPQASLGKTLREDRPLSSSAPASTEQHWHSDSSPSLGPAWVFAPAWSKAGPHPKTPPCSSETDRTSSSAPPKA
jgi:hypothetical protein